MLQCEPWGFRLLFIFQRTGWTHTSPQLERKKEKKKTEECAVSFFSFSLRMSVSSVLYSVSFVICMYKYTYNIIMQIVVSCRKNPLELTNILYQLITLIAINTTWLSQSWWIASGTANLLENVAKQHFIPSIPTHRWYYQPQQLDKKKKVWPVTSRLNTRAQAWMLCWQFRPHWR